MWDILTIGWMLHPVGVVWYGDHCMVHVVGIAWYGDHWYPLSLVGGPPVVLQCGRLPSGGHINMQILVHV